MAVPPTLGQTGQHQLGAGRNRPGHARIHSVETKSVFAWGGQRHLVGADGVGLLSRLNEILAAFLAPGVDAARDRRANVDLRRRGRLARAQTSPARRGDHDATAQALGIIVNHLVKYRVSGTNVKRQAGCDRRNRTSVDMADGGRLRPDAAPNQGEREMAHAKVALVTGGGSGIGRSAALALQGDGWNVVVTGRRKAELDKTVEMAKAGGGKMLGVVADVGKPDDVKRLFEETKKAFGGRLDFLFNNAGMGAPPVPMEELSFEQWKAVVDVNLTGSFLCAQEAIKIMKAQTPKGGRIVNNGSISAHTPRPNSVAYTSTKHAITGLTKCIALDGRKHDIACGQLDIGNADTAMGGRMKAGVPQANGTVAPEAVMDVEHCGSAIRYMASLPLDANVLFMQIKATKMPFEGRG